MIELRSMQEPSSALEDTRPIADSTLAGPVHGSLPAFSAFVSRLMTSVLGDIRECRFSGLIGETFPQVAQLESDLEKEADRLRGLLLALPDTSGKAH